MNVNGAGLNGSHGAGGPPGEAPAKVRELSEACVRFVERALGVKLDYQAETLSLLDHYIEEGREAARKKPETAALVAHAAGAYFGEVVRRRYASWWRAEGDDPGEYRIELEPVYLSFSPVQMMADALLRDDEASSDAPSERLELEEEDRAAVADRLAELPPVSEREFYAPSTRLEVIDIAVEAIRARKMAAGEEAEGAFGPEDYEG
jgi:hypothetical protein